MVEYILAALFESVVLALAVYYIQRRQRHADRRAEERAAVKACSIFR